MNYRTLREVLGVSVLAVGMLGCTDIGLGYLAENFSAGSEKYAARLPESFDYASPLLLSAGYVVIPKTKKRKR